jgi:hypothetical protein
MLRIITALVPILIASMISAGQTAPAQAETTKPDDYAAMVAKLKKGDTKIDFHALRIAYSETSDANPYGARLETRRSMNVAVQQQRCGEAIKIADEILKTTYLSPDVHAALSACMRAAGEIGKADFHKGVYLGLINSILSQGDGRTPDSAYIVISIEEEYAVMRALGLSVWAQQQMRRGEHSFEVLSGSNDKAKQTSKVFFNIDIPAALERRRMAK